MCFDPNHYLTAQLLDTLQSAANDLPALNLIEKLKPNFLMDGDQYCFMYGEFPHNCVAGFGDTAAAAMRDFYHNFYNETAKVEPLPDAFPCSAIELISEERLRQINVEGYDAAHDDSNVNEELASAAATYAMPARYREFVPGFPAPASWPWGIGFWKPTPDDRIRELVKAGALIVAEIERRQRLLVSNEVK